MSDEHPWALLTMTSVTSNSLSRERQSSEAADISHRIHQTPRPILTQYQFQITNGGWNALDVIGSSLNEGDLGVSQVPYCIVFPRPVVRRSSSGLVLRDRCAKNILMRCDLHHLQKPIVGPLRLG